MIWKTLYFPLSTKKGQFYPQKKPGSGQAFLLRADK